MNRVESAWRVVADVPPVSLVAIGSAVRSAGGPWWRPTTPSRARGDRRRSTGTT